MRGELVDGTELIRDILFLHDGQFFELLANDCPASTRMLYGRLDRVVAKGWIENGSADMLNALRLSH